MPRRVSEIGPASAKRDATNDYTPRGEGGQSGWLRVGRYDKAGRRALWVRVLPTEDPNTTEMPVYDSIELCAGREGDDAYVKIGPDNPAFVDLLDCILRAADHIPGRWK